MSYNARIFKAYLEIHNNILCRLVEEQDRPILAALLALAEDQMDTNGKTISRIACIHDGREATIEEVRNVYDVDTKPRKVADIRYQTALLPVSVPVEEINDITVYFDDGTNEFLGDPVIPVHIPSIARAEVSA